MWSGRAREGGLADRRGGTTVAEVAIVLACASLLAGVSLPALMGAREDSRQADCRGHLRRLGLAMHQYHDTIKSFPAGSTNRASWSAYLLPYLGERALYESAMLHEEARDIVVSTEAVTEPSVPAVLRCRAHAGIGRRRGATSYLASAGLQAPREPAVSTRRGVFRDESFALDGTWRTGQAPNPPNVDRRIGRGAYFTFRDNTDGTASTILLTETAHADVVWCPPFDPRRNRTLAWVDGEGVAIGPPQAVVSPGPPVVRSLFGSWHGRGVNVCLVDGSGAFLSDAIDRKVFEALLTIAGGEDEPGDDTRWKDPASRARGALGQP